MTGSTIRKLAIFIGTSKCLVYVSYIMLYVILLYQSSTITTKKIVIEVFINKNSLRKSKYFVLLRFVHE